MNNNKSTYLLELSFGPVQGFISAARRSRDLWAGSHILSEIARAAAKHLIVNDNDNDNELIYPIKSRVKKENTNENSNLSNVLLAIVKVDNEEGVKKLAAEAQAAARKKLELFAFEAWNKWGWGIRAQLRKNVWDAQIADAVESYAAWSLLETDEQGKIVNYRTSYDKLKKSFASRKNTRQFSPFSLNDSGIPKSSLDGIRESVLPKENLPPAREMGLSAGEQLDALGVVKRFVGINNKFAALTRVAAHSWISQLSAEDFKNINTEYEKLIEPNFATRTPSHLTAYAPLPYDAALLYPERLQAALQEVEKSTDHESLSVKETLTNLKNILKPLWKQYGHPCPYAALVQGDGDRMGSFIDLAQTKEHHNKVSSNVASFADQVPTIARDHAGDALYAGGEDLMLVLPLANLVTASEKLSECFAEEMKVTIGLLQATGENKPTLRIGAAICHVLEPLGTIRAHAVQAEKFAKGNPGTTDQGNALGLCLHIRAGHNIQVRQKFSDKQSFKNLKLWQYCYEKRIFPGRLAYDLRDIGNAVKSNRMAAAVGLAEWSRLLDRADLSIESHEAAANLANELGVALEEELEAKKMLNKVKKTIIEKLKVTAGENGENGENFLHLGNQLILARWLAARSATDVMI